MDFDGVCKAVLAMDDEELAAVYREAADTQSDEARIVHHVAAQEMAKRKLGLGKRTPFHREPAEVYRATVKSSDLNLPAEYVQMMPDVVDVVRVLKEDGTELVVEPKDHPLWTVGDVEYLEPVGKSDSLEVGDFVSWNTAGGHAQGRIVSIVRTGTLDVPDSSFTLNATDEDPAVLIELWRDGPRGTNPVDVRVGHRMSSLRRIDDLSKMVFKTIRARGDEWCVYSSDGSRSFGCYPTKAQAEERLAQIEMFKSDSPAMLRIPPAVKRAAQRALDALAKEDRWEGASIDECRARALADSDTLSIDEVVDMFKFFTSDEVVKAEEYRPFQWDSYGGDAGMSWSKDVVRRHTTLKVRPENPWKRGYTTEYFQNRDEILAKGPKCYLCKTAKATQVDHIKPVVDGGSNKKANLRPVCAACNRKTGGAVRRTAKADSFTPPKGVQQAAQRALDWIADGHAGSGFTDTGRRRAAQLAAGESVSSETLGRMRSFFARHSVNRDKTGWNQGEEGYPIPARVAWDAWGGDAGRSWSESTGVEKGVLVSKAVDEKRYTLGPMYVPNALDAQNEWTDEEELQQAVWRYVRSGDRRIRLQHNRDIVAGEWVECMAWPYEVSVPMMQPSGVDTGVDVVTFPANTVFLGVVWEPWAWALVKSGALRGFSIGGNAARVLADLPES